MFVAGSLWLLSLLEFLLLPNICNVVINLDAAWYIGLKMSILQQLGSVHDIFLILWQAYMKALLWPTSMCIFY